MACHLFFFIFVFTSTALELVSSEMEDAANILGAGIVKTAFKVTLPLVYPAILGGIIIVFLQSIALFGVPALIAIPARYPVVTTQLWQFFEYPVRVEVAAAYALPLLAITMLLLWLQKRILARKGYTTVAGKGGERRIVRLGIWRWIMLAYALFVAALAVVMPFIVLVQAAFAKAWGRGFSLDNLTFGNFHFILFEHQGARSAIVNSCRLCQHLGRRRHRARTGHRLHREAQPASLRRHPGLPVHGAVRHPRRRAGHRLLCRLCTRRPLSLGGTALIIILAFLTRLLPIAYQNSAAGIASIHPEMEEAVRVLGGGRLTAIRKVVAPLLKRTLVGAWILVFIPACQELSTAIFLTGPHTRVISVLMLDFSEEGRLEQLSALGGILLLITVVIVAVGFRVVGRDFMLRRS